MIRKFRLIFFLGLIVVLVMVFPFVKEKIQKNLEIKKSMEASEYITQKMSDCYDQKGADECKKVNAEYFVNNFELSDIMQVFAEKEKIPAFFNDCHAVAHYMGQAAYKKYGSIAKVFEEASHACLGGLYHGAVEGYFMAQGITDLKSGEARETVEHACGVATDYNDPQKFIECNHGLGHAMMYITKNDLLEALDLCDALASFNEQNLCYSGTLMANADSAGSKDHPTKYIKDDDPLYPCYVLKKQHQGQCYTYGVLSRVQFDLPKAISICESVPAEFQGSCFTTLGRDRTMTSADPVELKAQCLQIKKSGFRDDCISGTAYNLVIRFGANSDIPANYCDITDKDYKNNCYREIYRAINNITKDKEVINNFCGKIIDKNYESQCLNFH